MGVGNTGSLFPYPERVSPGAVPQVPEEKAGVKKKKEGLFNPSFKTANINSEAGQALDH